MEMNLKNIKKASELFEISEVYELESIYAKID